MPDLKIGKVIFEADSKDTAIIFQLTLNELEVIDEIYERGLIKKTAKSYRIRSMKEYMHLEYLFLQLVDYSEQTSINEVDKSRLDYTYNNDAREVRLINDKDGEIVKPWLDILEFIKNKLGIDFKSSSKGIGVSGRYITPEDGTKKHQSYIDGLVKDIVDKFPAGSVFTNAQIKDLVRATGEFDGIDNHKLLSKTFESLKKLIGNGVIVKLDNARYKK